MVGAYLYSKRVSHIALKPFTTADKTALDEIEKRLDNWMLAANPTVGDNPRPKALKGMVNKAKAKFDSMNIQLEVGAWTGTALVCGESPHINYGAEKFSRGTAETIFLPLALDYKLNNNGQSLEMLMKLFDFWHDQGWAYGSGIGSLDNETLRSSGYFGAVYLVREELKQTGRLERESKTVDWFSEFGKVYLDTSIRYEQTTADEMRTHFLNRLIRVLIMEDSAQKTQAMECYLEWVNGALRINPNRADTIKPDFTGFHHNNVYMNAYPPHGYHMASMINYILQGTKVAISKQASYNLKQALKTHDILTNSTTVPFQVRGRFPVQNSEIGQEILPSYAYMALSGNPETGASIDLEMAGIFMKNYRLIGSVGQKVVKGYNIGGISLIHTYGAYEVLMELIIMGIQPAQPQEGMWSMPYAGMAVLRQDDWMLAVKGFRNICGISSRAPMKMCLEDILLTA